MNLHSANCLLVKPSNEWLQVGVSSVGKRDLVFCDSWLSCVVLMTAGCLLLAWRKEFQSSDRAASSHLDMHIHVRAGTHTNYTNYKITTGQPDPAMESQVGAVFVHLCVSVCVAKPLGIQGPCRALAVLIRQPQPSKEHHRKKERMEEGERVK